MQINRNVLTPDNLELLCSIAESGSFAAAARQLDLVPSALTYRVRQIEDALDVLLFDRSTRQARPTPAGLELLHQAQRLLHELDAVAHRVRRVATGWEAHLTLAVDRLISSHILLELAQAFFAQQAPTRLKWSEEILGGPAEALASGQADLAIGDAFITPNLEGLQSAPLGELEFIFVVAPQHPLAQQPQPLSDEQLRAHRQIVVADSAQRRKTSLGILPGQEVFTVDSLHGKLQAQLMGLGGGFLPEPMVRAHIAAGLLLPCQVQRPQRKVQISYMWRQAPQQAPGRALQWWLTQLQSPLTRQALLEHHLPQLLHQQGEKGAS